MRLAGFNRVILDLFLYYKLCPNVLDRVNFGATQLSELFRLTNVCPIRVMSDITEFSPSF